MPFTFHGRTLTKVGVIGSGQIGPDIALYFSKMLAPFGVKVVVVDIAAEALTKGRARLEKKIDKGVEGKAFKADEGAAMKAAVTFTNEYAQLADAQFVVEAATESAEIKAKIFAQLESICAPTAILASNSSHLEPEVIAANLKLKGRSLVIHYFFPAERNYMVEVVPGKDTDAETAAWTMRFYEAIGKVPIRVGSRYGYAVDPVFEGLFLAAALCVEAGLGTTKEVDTVATKALGLTVGPFTAMNLTGGNAITGPGLAKEGEKIMPWFRTPEILKQALATKSAWEVPARGETVTVPEDRAKAITESLQGAYLGIVDEILSAGLTNLADFEMALEMGLDIEPPARLANRLGVARALELAQRYAANNPGFAAPRCLAAAAQKGGAIEVSVVLREDLGEVAVLTVRRPKSLNSLDEACFAQLTRHFEAIKTDPKIRGAVLTGFGTKAFVSGADVRFLARIDSPETGMRDARNAQKLTLLMESLGKPIVCAMNGLAFGGGLEVASACTARIAAQGLKILGGQPEVNLGIIPGAGGTQRLPRIVGLEKGAALLRTGRPVSGKEALEIGLISEEVPWEGLVQRAVNLAKDLAAQRVNLPPMPKGPLPQVPTTLPACEIGHLSRAIDAILCRAILEGARSTLERGLEIENAAFGDVCRTKDMRIGLDTFLKEGARAKAAFIHA